MKRVIKHALQVSRKLGSNNCAMLKPNANPGKTGAATRHRYAKAISGGHMCRWHGLTSHELAPGALRAELRIVVQAASRCPTASRSRRDATLRIARGLKYGGKIKNMLPNEALTRGEGPSVSRTPHPDPREKTHQSGQHHHAPLRKRGDASGRG